MKLNSFMDRRSIIQSTYLENSYTINDNSCGEEVCECDVVKTDGEKTQLRSIAIIVLLAFACALGLTVPKINAVETALKSKKAGTIACYSKSDKQTRKKIFSYNDYQSNKNNNGNCPHPSAYSVPGCCNDSKRKKNQAC
jgi:Pyruvate/2-oxoacid:ferredoxin oxidoreductase gamma subunit